ncbi:MAG: DUF6514 family protein [Oscillospiraceae bacterium]
MILNQSTSVTLQQEDAAGGKLRYSLIQHNCHTDSEEGNTYGIRIECSLFGETENVAIYDITPNIDYALELYEIVRLYMITPISLNDIVEDFLTEKYG